MAKRGEVGKNNLIPMNKRTEKEQKEIAKKGGIASGKARKEKADLKKQLQVWLESYVAKDKQGNPITGSELMVQVAAKEISKGSPRFWELVRDTAGFKPVDKVIVADVDQEVIDEVEAMVYQSKEPEIPAEPKKPVTKKRTARSTKTVKAEDAAPAKKTRKRAQ